MGVLDLRDRRVHVVDVRGGERASMLLSSDSSDGAVERVHVVDSSVDGQRFLRLLPLGLRLVFLLGFLGVDAFMGAPMDAAC